MTRIVVAALLLLVISMSAPAATVVWRAIKHSAPEYPEQAKGKHLRGSGVFELHVRPDGSVQRVDVIASTGHRLLDDHAIAVFQKWRFDPHIPIRTLRIPVRYLDAPAHVDDVMRRPPPPGYSKVFTIFVPAKT